MLAQYVKGAAISLHMRRPRKFVVLSVHVQKKPFNVQYFSTYSTITNIIKFKQFGYSNGRHRLTASTQMADRETVGNETAGREKANTKTASTDTTTGTQMAAEMARTKTGQLAARNS